MKNGYKDGELDIILDRLEDELKQAINREEISQIKASIGFFLQEKAVFEKERVH